MATIGPLYPGTTASLSNAGSSEDSNAWVNTGNIVSDNGSEATITAATYDSPDISELLVASNFGFTIPAGSTINGITVEIERRCTAGSASDNRVQLSKGTTFASLVGSNKAATVTAWPGSVAVASYGGTSDLWGTTWTESEVNASSFAVMLSVQADSANTDINVDYIRVTVDYTPGPGLGFAQANARIIGSEPELIQALGTVANATAGQTSTVITVTNRYVRVGELIAVGWHSYFNITASTVTDNLGNSYSRSQRSTAAQTTSEFWYAPVTVGGQITTITVAHASTQYLSAIAASFANVGAFVESSGGTTGISNTGTWASNKTIPAHGIAIGDSMTSAGISHAPGSASGSPSTTILEAVEIVNGPAVSGAMYYATNASEVTSFTGTATYVDVVEWAGSGAIFGAKSSGATTANAYAQAQASIKATSNAFAQAQTRVKQIYFGHAQSQARIKQTYFGYSQANAYIKATDVEGFAQSQSHIKTTYFAHSQAQATVKATMYGYAQAQTQVKQTYVGHAQTNALIAQTTWSHSQSQAQIKATVFGHSQTQATIKATMFGHGQAQSRIKQTYQGSSQANAWIEQTYRGHAQGQAQIKQTYRGYAQALASIRSVYNGSGAAQGWIVALGAGHANAQAQIKEITLGYAQAQARIAGTIAGDPILAVSDSAIRLTLDDYSIDAITDGGRIILAITDVLNTLIMEDDT